jgi:predicted ester cyclase
MNKRETVQALMDSVQKGDFENAKSMLADDFQFSGSTPGPIDRDSWVRMSTSLQTAFPDLDYHFKVVGTEGHVVQTTSQWSGTHTGALDLTDMNLGVIPATSKSFVANRDWTRLTVKENKISSWVVEPAQGAGLMEILKQLDANMPVVSPA